MKCAALHPTPAPFLEDGRGNEYRLLPMVALPNAKLSLLRAAATVSASPTDRFPISFTDRFLIHESGKGSEKC